VSDARVVGNAKCSKGIDQQNSSVQCTSIQYSVEQSSSMQLNAVQYSAEQSRAAQYSTVQSSSIQYSAEQLSAAECSAVHCSSVQFRAVQWVVMDSIKNRQDSGLATLIGPDRRIASGYANACLWCGLSEVLQSLFARVLFFFPDSAIGHV
jgi:hypothetical protein